MLGISGNRASKVAVFGVVFPLVANFLDDYLSSLSSQSMKDFDLVIVNDGFGDFAFTANRHDLKIREANFRRLSPAEIREKAIKLLRDEGYEYIIFTDSDDYFSANRIEECLGLLEAYDIVLNDVTTVRANSEVIEKRYFSHRLKEGEIINMAFIEDKNVFGFSNTAVRTSCLVGDFSFEPSLIAVDWYFFSLLLMNGAKAVFTDKAETYYRMHQHNTVGLARKFSEGSAIRALEVRKEHYNAMAKLDIKYDVFFVAAQKLRGELNVPSKKERIIKKMGKFHSGYPLWWEIGHACKEIINEN